jgi:hypothetical protein
MIKNFQSYNESVVPNSVVFNIRDYCTTYDNIHKLNYRNVETGDVFRIFDLFKGTFGLFINDNDFRIFQENDTEFRLFDTKKGKHLELWPNMGWKNTWINQTNKNDKDNKKWLDKYRIGREDKKKVIIPIEGYITTYDVNRFLTDIRTELKYGYRTLIGYIKQGYREEQLIGVRQPRYITIQENNGYEGRNTNFNVVYIDMSNGSDPYGTRGILNIAKPVKLKQTLRKFTEIDPLGEEDWDD